VKAVDEINMKPQRQNQIRTILIDYTGARM